MRRTAASGRTGRPHPSTPHPSTPHHGAPEHAVVLLMESDPDDGLSQEEAAERLTRYGRNELPAPRGPGAVVRALRQLQSPIVVVLLVAAAVTAVLGELVDTVVILTVVAINAVVGFVQESRAEAALDGLRDLVRTRAVVVRGGGTRVVPSEELVPGDLVRLEAGEKVPADLRLMRASALQVDESALTGESVPAQKRPGTLPAAVPVADRSNMLYSGTLVVAGTGDGIVVATGGETEVGEIHRLVGAAAPLTTPLTAKLTRFSRVLTIGILALAALTFAIGLLRGEDVADMVTAAIALAVGAIPEGLPAAVTITLAIGVGRMARRRAVIRRLPAVETLGSTTVICSDKTGTLTRNQMTVQRIWTPDDPFTVTGSGYAPHGAVLDAAGAAVRADDGRLPALRWALLAGAACNDAAILEHGGVWDVAGDPTEGALLVAAAKAGIGAERIEALLPRIASLPFTSDRQLMATLHLDRTPGGADRQVVLLKGAIERVLDRCDAELDRVGRRRPLDRAAALAAAEEAAAEGLRVLAIAIAHPARPLDPGAFADGAVPSGAALVGLQAMLDPPRPAAIGAVRACHDAGIAVKMVTGDHLATAVAVARRMGVVGNDADGLALTGADLAALPPERLPDAVERAAVLARVSPEQKLRLVEALQAAGHVVAMTGDGVNDAPALRQAGIGVAMGLAGTEVAKDAADMVLLDDDFATVEAAVEEGRGVFDNLTKFIAWTLPTNIGEGLVILAAIAAGSVLPVLPTQILWINMTTAVALGLMLAFEPKEPGIMRRPPRDPARPLLDAALVVRILLVSALLVAGAWALFEWELAHGAAITEARTTAVNLFVAVEAVYLVSCRSLDRPIRRIGYLTNRWVVVGIAAQAAGQLALTYLPAMNAVFATAPISWDAWLRIAALAAVAAVVIAVDKRARAGRT